MATSRNEKSEVCASTLPIDLWIEILKTDVLDARDLCNVALVCRWLHEITSNKECSNEIWRAKFHEKWPRKMSSNCLKPDWRATYRGAQQVQRAVEQAIKDVAADNYHNHNELISNEHFDKFVKASELQDQGLLFVIEDLFAILESPRHTRLTDKFFAKHAVQFMQQQHLRTLWDDFFKKPQDEQHLEMGARLVSWWMQASKREDQFDAAGQLDTVADKVRTQLHSQGLATHPACRKDNCLTGFQESLWTRDQNRQVLEAVNKVLFQDLALRGNDDDYHDMNNSFLTQVLERQKGIPITLSVIYQAVARRLGVVCRPVNFPNHFLLVFKEHGLSGCGEEVRYIDAYNRGRQLTAEECMSTFRPDRQYDQSYFLPVEPKVVLERMARNLVCLLSGSQGSEQTLPVFQNAVSLFLAICPHDQQMTIVYANLCVHLGINLPQVIDLLTSRNLGVLGVGMLHQCQMQMDRLQQRDVKKTVKIRSTHPEVELSVGMVMTHKRYNYTCVIYGWDEECKASQEWILQMGVDQLPGKQHQPFYNVLVGDGTTRYAAQENLLNTVDVKEITHNAVGRYFQEFTERYYIPNPSKDAEYPDDREVTRTLMDDFFSSHPPQD
ncbi:hypothetical protein ACOMHN_026198 [Nucella lapillus]